LSETRLEEAIEWAKTPSRTRGRSRARDGVLRRTARVQQLGRERPADKVNELIAEITVEIAMVTAKLLVEGTGDGRFRKAIGTNNRAQYQRNPPQSARKTSFIA